MGLWEGPGWYLKLLGEGHMYLGVRVVFGKYVALLRSSWKEPGGT